MNHSEEIDQLATALAAFQAEVPAIPKGDNNPFFKSKYAGLPDVVALASPIAAKHGLAITQTIGFGYEMSNVDTLTTMLMHKSGQWISDIAQLHLTKEDSQGHGSAVTYMRRYAYMAVLGLVADDDDDGNAASRSPSRSRQNDAALGYKDSPSTAQKATTRRSPPRPQPEAVPKAHAKNELLAACQGDMIQTKTLWEQAGGEFNGDTVSRAALDRLLAKAKAATELEGAT